MTTMTTIPKLFSSLQVGRSTLRNRIGVSPMCQYSCETLDGVPSAWHMVHYGRLATAGGAGIIITEATAVNPAGRISLRDTGIWDDKQVAAWRPIASFIRSHGCFSVMQIAHAGRKAATLPPWQRTASVGYYTRAEVAPHGLLPVGPSSRAFEPGAAPLGPREMTREDIDAVKEDWGRAARNAVAAGFDTVELHFAHGYLVSEFCSPLVNERKDEYGGERDGRMRLAVEIAERCRREIPWGVPLFARINGTDWADGGWEEEDCVALATALHRVGVDVIDVSSGGAVAKATHLPVDSSLQGGYQVRFAAAVKKALPTATVATVGLITDPHLAEEIVSTGRADIVLVGRGFIDDASWGLHAARTLKAPTEEKWPPQYAWCVGPTSGIRKNKNIKL